MRRAGGGNHNATCAGKTFTLFLEPDGSETISAVKVGERGPPSFPLVVKRTLLGVLADAAVVLHGAQAKIEAKLGTPKHEQILIVGGKQLDDDRTVASYPHIEKGSTFHVVMRLRGGQLQQ